MTVDTTNYYLLALKAGVPTPDEGSAGADWLLRVGRAADELRAVSRGILVDGDLDDNIAELADSLVPIYTADRWRVFVDLEAWTEDVEELTGAIVDLTDAAGVALYLIAERLLYALTIDEDDEEEE